MSIIAQCPDCRKRIKAPDRLAGKRARCKCGGILAIPGGAPATVEPVVPEELDTGGADPGPMCPSCQTPMSAEAVLCTSCGFNRQTGQRLSVSVDEAASAAPGPVPKPQKPPRKKVERSPETASKLIGFAFGLIKWSVVVAVVGGLAWVVKEGVSFSPAEQAAEAQKKIYPGMTVQAVVDALDGKTPQEVHVYKEVPKTTGGVTFITTVDRNVGYRHDFMNNIDEELVKNGFYFVYRYSERDNLQVYFTPEGKVDRTIMFDPMKLLGL